MARLRLSGSCPLNELLDRSMVTRLPSPLMLGRLPAACDKSGDEGAVRHNHNLLSLTISLLGSIRLCHLGMDLQSLSELISAVAAKEASEANMQECAQESKGQQ